MMSVMHVASPLDFSSTLTLVVSLLCSSCRVSPSKGKTCGSKTPWKTLQNRLLSEEETGIFTVNDSCSAFGENQKFHSGGAETQTQEGCVRSLLVESVCERFE